MMDLAFEFRFSSDNTLIRAFRRRFGLTPGEVRELSALRAREGNGAAHADPIAGIRHPASRREIAAVFRSNFCI